MSFVRKEDVEAIVAEADPHDGFRVKDVVVGGEHSLHLVFRRGGVPVAPPWRIGGGMSKQVWARKDPTPEQIGEKRRLIMLLEAVCRFMNTCGDWNQLEDVLSGFSTMIGGDLQLALCGSFQLIDSCVTTEGMYEHVFYSPESPWAIRWADEQFFDVVSLNEINRELQEQEASEPDVLPGGTDQGFGEDLPRQPDHRQLEAVEGDAGEDVPGPDPEG